MKRWLLATFMILASVNVGAPPASVGQQAKLPRIGVLLLSDPEIVMVKPLFSQALRDVGLIEGQNVHVDYRSAGGQVDRLDALATDLVRLKVDVIVTRATPPAQAAKRATTEIPIVMAPAGDPIRTGLVASLARPGGNVTGLSSTIADLGGKLLGLIRETRPSIRSVAVLVHSTDPFTPVFLEQLGSSSGRIAVRLRAFAVSSADEFDSAFMAMAEGRAEALVVQPILATKRTADLALRYRLPSITAGVTGRTFPEVGGLMSYGINPAEFYRRAAVYVDKILKGAKPADLPVEQPTKFELVINLKTAKALGLTVPPSLLLQADHVIE